MSFETSGLKKNEYTPMRASPGRRDSKMIHRERLILPRYIYSIDEWKISEKRFDPEFLGLSLP